MSGGAAAAVAAENKRQATTKAVAYQPGQKAFTISRVSRDSNDTLWVYIKTEESMKTNKASLFYEKLDTYLARVFEGCDIHSTHYNTYLRQVDVIYSGERKTTEPSDMKVEHKFSWDVLSAKITIVFLFLTLIFLAGAFIF